MRRVTNTPPSVFLTSVQTDHSAERAWLQEDRPCDRWCTLRDCGGLSVPNFPLSCALLQESDFVGPPSPELPYWLSLMLHQSTGVSKDRITVINQTICVNWDDSCPSLIVQIKILTFPKGKARFRIRPKITRLQHLSTHHLPSLILWCFLLKEGLVPGELPDMLRMFCFLLSPTEAMLWCLQQERFKFLSYWVSGMESHWL